MTLPFPTDNHVRKYTCFVCGVAFTEFQEYNSHILAEHELSREFVQCPLERCKACVRDLRLHFKVCHANEKIPKVGQMKAMIWKDKNLKTGKMTQQKTKFREGYLTSTKNGGQEMHYRSGMECDVYECLECMPEVISYDVEPFKVQYSFLGEIHEYNPDLKVAFDDGRVEIWEIKPSNQTHLPKNKAKWTACQQYCDARGYNFMVLTEIGMDKLKQKIREQKNNA